VIFTSLPDDKAIRDLLLAKGLLDAIAPQSILIETSTVSAEISAELGEAAHEHKIDYLRLPVSGNAAIAHTGALTCFVSGSKAAFERVKPLLASFTRAQTYLGEAEQARYAKLAVNLMIAVSAGMMAESLALARKGGIGWQDILKVLDDSAVASPMVKYKTPPLARRDFESTFSCRQMAKDLDLILGAGHSTGVPLQLAAQLRETYSSLIAQGDGDADYIATVLHQERLSGLGDPEL
jgi:3-hydroxyisobutyrate dehydrogenase-like beta-hydroxyacid dehydrogenase